MIEAEIAKKLTKAAALEQMAEEAAELAQAALKYARILRGENPTPVTEREAIGYLSEEVADVLVCMDVVMEYPDALYGVDEKAFEKKARWLDRLKGRAEK